MLLESCHHGKTHSFVQYQCHVASRSFTDCTALCLCKSVSLLLHTGRTKYLFWLAASEPTIHRQFSRHISERSRDVSDHEKSVHHCITRSTVEMRRGYAEDPHPTSSSGLGPPKYYLGIEAVFFYIPVMHPWTRPVHPPYCSW